jgi:hypothetical protein
MVYYSNRTHKLLGYRRSSKNGKKYDAILERRKDKKIIYVPFGASAYSNYQDKTGLNLYKTHGNEKRRTSYRARHKKDLKSGFYSAGFFSYYILW